jgi:uncharacterized protein (DUF1330 family)
MKGYIIADVEIHDPEAYADYRAAVPATLEAYGGRFIARGGETEVLEGDWQPKRIVVLEFDSPEQARAWYESEEYRDPKALRQRTSTASLILVSGVE